MTECEMRELTNEDWDMVGGGHFHIPLTNFSVGNFIVATQGEQIVGNVFIGIDQTVVT